MATSRRWCSFWAPLVEEFIAECERVERRTGRPVARSFRIHWDGDFYSLPYAQAWRETVLRYPDEFWAYTRSFRPELNVVPLLRDVPGLTLYLSVDAANYRDAERVLDQFPETLVSVLAPTVAAGKVLYRTLTGRSAAACRKRSASCRSSPIAAGAPASPAACAWRGVRAWSSRRCKDS